MLNEIVFNEGIHITNNLKFRTESSKVLANYKIAQSFALMELSKTTTHVFSTTAKELVLANYDAWFLFLIDMEHVLTMATEHKNFRKIAANILSKCKIHLREDEKIFLENVIKRKTVLEYDVKEILKLLALFRYRVCNKVIEHEPIFDKKYITIWHKIHEALFQALLHKITATGLDYIVYYNKVGLFVSQLLHHVLYEVYEIDLVFNKEPYLILNCDNIVSEIYEELKINLLINRIEVYMREAEKLGYRPTEIRLKIYDEFDKNIVRELEKYSEENKLILRKEV